MSFSVPEDQRSKRHVLRSQLSWLGFGNLSNGLWMAPRRMRDELEKTVEQLGFQQYVLMFEAQYTGFAELSSLVSEAWGRTELTTLYAEFVDWCAPVTERWKDVRHPSGAQVFIDYTLALYHWRKFPTSTPGCPRTCSPTTG